VGQQFKNISETYIEFISEQKLFFVGTAKADSTVNIANV
jgi:hypothetical protein